MAQVGELQKIAEGREAEIYAWADGQVLRLFRGARSAEGVEHEAAAMRAARSVVPSVPEAVGITEVMGRPGLILERVDGPDLISMLGRQPWTVRRAGRICGELQAQLHGVRAPAALPSLKERIRRIVRESPLVPPELGAAALRALEHLPEGGALCHGDFHPGNVLMSRRGPVVIDWPNAARGHPVADLARSVLMLRIATLPPGTPLVVRLGDRIVRRLFVSAYLGAYRKLLPFDEDLLERWAAVRAVDRLAEDIPEERDATLAVAARLRDAAPPRQA